MKNDELEDFYDLLLVQSTSKAYLVQDENNDKYWIPVSQVKQIEFGKDLVNEEGKAIKEINLLTIPTWLAKKVRLI